MMRTDEDRLFQGAGRSIRDRQFINRNLELLPGVFSFDPRTHNWQRRVVARAKRELPVDLLPSLHVGPSGVAEEWDKCLAVAGVLQVPASYPIVGNEHLRAQNGLRNSLTDREKAIHRKLAECFLSRCVPSSIAVARYSQGGPPDFLREPAEKLAAAEEAITEKFFHATLKNQKSGNLRRNLKDFNYTDAYFNGGRSQPDAPDKKRYYNDFEFARTGGRKGVRAEVDKKVVIDGKTVPNMTGMRYRVVRGASLRPNILQQTMAAACRSLLKHAYAPTFHHTTRDQRNAKLNAYPANMAQDISNFDAFAYEDGFKEWDAVYQKYYGDDMLLKHVMLRQAPYYQPSVGPNEPGRWMGNPLIKNHFVVRTGIPSGDAWVDVWGKYFAVAETLCVVDAIIGGILEANFDDILNHRHPTFAILDLGDDLHMLGTEKFIDSYRKARAQRGEDGRVLFGMYEVSPEKGCKFVGDLTMQMPDGSFRYIPNIGSYFSKRVCAERAITDPFRSHWYIGEWERKLLFGECPAFDALDTIINEEFERPDTFKHAGSILALTNSVARLNSYIPPHVRSVADVEVLIEPSRLGWRWDRNEVSDEIAQAVSLEIPIEKFEWIFNKHYTGEVIDARH